MLSLPVLLNDDLIQLIAVPVVRDAVLNLSLVAQLPSLCWVASHIWLEPLLLFVAAGQVSNLAGHLYCRLWRGLNDEWFDGVTRRI